MLSDYDMVMWWLRNNEVRKLELSHGGQRGTFYARMIDEDGNTKGDGVGGDAMAAIGECALYLRIETLMKESE